MITINTSTRVTCTVPESVLLHVPTRATRLSATPGPGLNPQNNVNTSHQSHQLDNITIVDFLEINKALIEGLLLNHTEQA